MNTPAHAVVNLLLLSRNGGQARVSAIVAGALIPDLAIIGFYAWQLVRDTPESVIWSVEYHQPFWQGLIDSFNSIPLILLAILACALARRPLALAFFASMLLHCLGDLPLHHDDAHRHFFPFSDWRFASPVSYWDPAHHGALASLAEIAAVLAASAFLYWRRPPLRRWIVALLSIYLLYWGYVLTFWM